MQIALQRSVDIGDGGRPEQGTIPGYIQGPERSIRTVEAVSPETRTIEHVLFFLASYHFHILYLSQSKCPYTRQHQEFAVVLFRA